MCKDTKCNRHLGLWILIFILLFPIILSSISIMIIGIMCIGSSNTNDISQCNALFFNSRQIRIVGYVTCLSQIALNFSVLLSLSYVGCYSCSHCNIPVKKKKKVYCLCFGAKCQDCRCCGAWFLYWIPTIALVFDVIWNYMYNDEQILFSIVVIASILFNTLHSMTIFPLVTTSAKDLKRRGLLSMETLNKSNRLAPVRIVEERRNEMSLNGELSTEEEIDTNGTDLMELFGSNEDRESSLIFCLYNFRPRYTWMPYILFLSFFQNVCWSVYDIARFSIIVTGDPTSIDFLRVNLVLSLISIGYRVFHTMGYWRKMMYMDSIYFNIVEDMDIEKSSIEATERYIEEKKRREDRQRYQSNNSITTKKRSQKRYIEGISKNMEFLYDPESESDTEENSLTKDYRDYGKDDRSSLIPKRLTMDENNNRNEKRVENSENKKNDNDNIVGISLNDTESNQIIISVNNMEKDIDQLSKIFNDD